MHFEQTLCIRIVIDDTGHIVYELYYELCHVIAGRSFTRKKDRTWYNIFLSVLYSLVKSNTVQRLEQLPLVFVNSLYMNIKHHVRADFHPFPFTDFVYKFLFADLLGLHPLLLKFRIVGILFQTFELIEPGNPSRSYFTADKIPERWVGFVEPAPLGHSVCLAVKLIRPHVMEIFHQPV